MAVNNKLNQCALSEAIKFKKLIDEEGIDIQKLADEIDDIAESAKMTGQDEVAAIRKFLLAQHIDLKQKELTRKRTLVTSAYNKKLMEQQGKVIENVEAMVGLNDKQKGGYQPMSVIKNRYRNILSGIFGEMEIRYPKTFKRMRNNELDLLVSLGKYFDGKTDHGLDEGGKFLADGIRKSMDNIYNKKLLAGFDVQYLKGYIGKQRHPSITLREIGFEKWAELQKKYFNWEPTRKATLKEAQRRLNAGENFDPKTLMDEILLKEMRSTYDNIVNRPIDSMWEIMPDMDKLTKINAQKAIESSRKLIPKSAEDYLRYTQELGVNYYENLLRDFDESAGDIAAGMTFGPNYRAGFNSVIQYVKDGEISRPMTAWEKVRYGSPESRWKTKEKELRAAFEYVVREKKSYAENLLGFTAMKMLQFTDLTKLQAPFFSIPSDWAATVGAITRVNGKSFISTFKDFMVEYTKNMAPDLKNKQREIFLSLGVFYDDALHETAWSRSALDGLTKAKFGSKILQRVSDGVDWWHDKHMKMTGLSRSDRAARKAGAKLLARDMVDSVNLGYNKLSDDKKRIFNRFGISETEFPILEKAITKLPDDSMAIPVEDIAELDLELFPGKTKPEKALAREKLTNAVFGYLEDLPSRGVANNDLAMKTWMASLDVNTVSGAVFRMMMRYKSYPIAILKTHAFILNSGSKNLNYGLLTKTAATSLILGAAAWTARKVAYEGVPIEDIEYNDKALVEIALRSNLGGIYSDFLISDRNFENQVVGPVIGGPIADIKHLLTQSFKEQPRTKQGFRSTIEKEWVSGIDRNLPIPPYVRIIFNQGWLTDLKDFIE